MLDYYAGLPLAMRLLQLAFLVPVRLSCTSIHGHTPEYEADVVCIVLRTQRK